MAEHRGDDDNRGTEANATAEGTDEDERHETRVIRRAANAILRSLTASPGRRASWADTRKMAKEDDGLDIPEPTLRKARDLLKELGTIAYDGKDRCWAISDDGALLPRHFATNEHIDAMRLATSSIQQSFPESRLSKLVRAVLYDVEEAKREQRAARQEIRPRDDIGTKPAFAERPQMHPLAVVHTSSSFEAYDPDLLLSVARACRKRRLSFRYESIWGDKSNEQQVEPAMIRFHDGIPYLRAYSSPDARWGWFRVSRISNLNTRDQFVFLECPRDEDERRIQEEKSSAMATGVDQDRPGEARIVIQGPMADWARTVRFSDGQEDAFDGSGSGRLERRFHYSSLRELARRLLFFGDALVDVEPAQLRAAIVEHAESLRSRLSAST